MTQVSIELLPPHAAQRRVLDNRQRFNVLSCGRRWGKTMMSVQLAVRTALSGKPAGWFAPSYKLLSDAWDQMTEVLHPLIAARIAEANKSERQIRICGTVIDFWTLERPNAGRGRKYARAIIDEAAIARNFREDWTRAIRPTLG